MKSLFISICAFLLIFISSSKAFVANDEIVSLPGNFKNIYIFSRKCN